MSTGLNKAGGEKRLRYESHSNKLNNTNIDIVHRTNKDFSKKNVSPILSCHFLDELDECTKLECNRSFKRYQTKLLSFIYLHIMTYFLALSYYQGFNIHCDHMCNHYLSSYIIKIKSSVLY